MLHLLPNDRADRINTGSSNPYVNSLKHVMLAAKFTFVTLKSYSAVLTPEFRAEDSTIHELSSYIVMYM